MKNLKVAEEIRKEIGKIDRELLVLLQTIIEEIRRLRDEIRSLTAFQGEHGAYGEVAARRLVSDGVYIPCLEFIDVFRGGKNARQGKSQGSGGYCELFMRRFV